MVERETASFEKAAAALAERSGVAATHAAAAPGRVNLIGEHTDYNGGFVMPIAIDRVCVAAGAIDEGSDPAGSTLVAADIEGVPSVQIDLAAPFSASDVASVAPRGSWPGYIAGVLSGFIDRFGPPPGRLDVAVSSAVPPGSGLSSSAALEVAAATLAEQLWGEPLEPRDKALLAQRAEHEFAGVPCGIMDQFIAVMARRDHALLIDCRTLDATPVAMPGPERLALIVANTGVKHALADGEYGKRRAACASAAKKLGVETLRDADGALLDARADALTDEERRCARHVVTEHIRTLAAANALREGDLAGAGAQLLDAHASLRDDYRVSCDELDALVSAAADHEGVFGARMTGGGFGGCAIVLCDPAHADHVDEHLCQTFADRFGRPCETFRVAASDGCGPLAVPARRGPHA